MTKGNNRSGFTLVELAIVLVIIGLIVGGVLVGQDLIKAASVRATVSQIEKYDTAANTFRNKYNSLPGDFSTAANFFSGLTIAGGDARGDNDGLIEDISATTPTLCTAEICLGGENMVFWTQLALAGLISEPTTAVVSTDNVTATPADNNMPQSKLGRGGRFAVAARDGRNYYVIGNPGTSAAVAGSVTWTPGIVVIDAFNIDTKTDDGVPTTGKTLSVDDAAPVPGTADNSGTASTNCYNGTAYNTLSNMELVACNLSVRTSF